jgi:hypothetical protein
MEKSIDLNDFFVINQKKTFSINCHKVLFEAMPRGGSFIPPEQALLLISV